MRINSPYITGSAIITGNLCVQGTIVGTITGVASTASYALNAETLDGLDSTQFTQTGSFNSYTSSASSSVGSLSGSIATTTSDLSSSIGGLSSSVATTTSNLSSSVATTTSNLSSSIGSLSSSVATTTSGLAGRITTVEGNYATTGSNIFSGTQTITGSFNQLGDMCVTGNITSTGQIIAQTINVQQVTSSIVYSCGSNTFGNSLSNTQQFTGSVFVTGSLIVDGGLTGNSASFSGSVRINAPINGTNKLIFGTTSNDYYWLEYNDSTGDIGYNSKYKHLFYGGVCGTCQILSISNIGEATFSNTLTACGPVNDWGLSIWGNTTTGQSYGGIVRGGTNSCDVSFRVNNAANNSTYFTIQGNGNTGIGCNNPQAKLDILRGSGDNLRFIGSGIGDYSDMVFFASNNSTRLGYIDWSNTQSRWNVEANIPMILYTNSCERIRISADGNVGIGTVTGCLSEKFTVLGTGWFTDVAGVGGGGGQLRLVKNASSTPATFTIFGYDNLSVNQAAGAIDFALQNTGNCGQTAASIRALNGDINESSANLAFYTTTNSLSASAGLDSTERMIILSDGKISINRSCNSYHQLSIKSNGVLSYQGLGVYSNSNDRFISLNHTGTVGYLETENAGSGVFTDLGFKTSGNDRIRITSCGCVGIGTCTPGSILHIKGPNPSGDEFGAEVRIWENSFGANIQGSTQGNTYAFFGNFRYNFTTASDSRSNYYAAGHGLLFKDGVSIISSLAATSGTCTGCKFTPSIRLNFNNDGIACFACQVCAPGLNITTNPIGVEYLLVGGGGGGGWDVGGGGGAGGVLQGSTGLYLGVYNVSIGAGGAGSNRSCHVDGCQFADRGNPTYAIGLSALGGGGGGNYAGGSGGHGASGGGGAGYGATTTGGFGMVGSGCKGGDSVPSFGTGATGGGGGGATGQGCPSACALTGCVSGGSGILSLIIGSSCSFACGGRGGGDSWTGNIAGPTNSGYGGDGAGVANSVNNGSNGGSGIFVIKMRNTNSATFSGGLTTTTCTNLTGFNVYVVTAGTGTMTIS